jgi:hypothetical protein
MNICQHFDVLFALQGVLQFGAPLRIGIGDGYGDFVHVCFPLFWWLILWHIVVAYFVVYVVVYFVAVAARRWLTWKNELSSAGARCC